MDLSCAEIYSVAENELTATHRNDDFVPDCGGIWY